METGTKRKTEKSSYPMKKSQNTQVLEYLQTGKSLSPLEAMEKLNILRLGARVRDLRLQGFQITTTMEWSRDGLKRWARYSLSLSGANQNVQRPPGRPKKVLGTRGGNKKR